MPRHQSKNDLDSGPGSAPCWLHGLREVTDLSEPVSARVAVRMSRCVREDSRVEGLPCPVRSYKLNAIPKWAAPVPPSGSKERTLGVPGRPQMCGTGDKEKATSSM